MTFVRFPQKSYVYLLSLRKGISMAKKKTNSPKNKKSYNISRYKLSLNENSRIDFRQHLARVFLTEQPGSGNVATRYYYRVEKDSVSGNYVYLLHPANLNKGFDFTIHIENQVFVHITKKGTQRKDDIPSHQNIVDDLLAKKAEDLALFMQMKPLLNKTFQCVSVDDTEYKAFPFKSGLSVEILFKTIKWLFIEQDITYWNWSGREMLYNGLIALW